MHGHEMHAQLCPYRGVLPVLHQALLSVRQSCCDTSSDSWQAAWQELCGLQSPSIERQQDVKAWGSLVLLLKPGHAGASCIAAQLWCTHAVPASIVRHFN